MYTDTESFMYEMKNSDIYESIKISWTCSVYQISQQQESSRKKNPMGVEEEEESLQERKLLA